MDALYKYLRVFKNLRIDRAHGNAPHKPILLLSILQTFQSRVINNNRIYITPELVALFKANWNILVTSNHHCTFALPFYHLTSDKFWKLIPKTGFENILQIKSSMKSFGNLNAAVEYAILDDDLLVLAQDNKTNSILQQLLLEEYFPSTKSGFINSVENQQEILENIGIKILRENPAEYRSEIQLLQRENNDEEIFLRGSIFKREIPKIYNNTCCISGMRIDATFNISMIDACHIIPFSESYDDTISNGIALCPNLHRAFDRGLIAIDDDYRVLISSKFIESDSSYLIKRFEGQSIKLPNERQSYPSKSNFILHRIKHQFQLV